MGRAKDSGYPEHLEAFKWQRGQSANPKGRPKHSMSITDELRRYLRAHPNEIRELVIAWLKLAKTGNSQALNELLNRLEGKVTERHEFEAMPVTLVFQPVLAPPVGGIAPPELIEANVIEGEAKVIE